MTFTFHNKDTYINKQHSYYREATTNDSYENLDQLELTQAPLVEVDEAAGIAPKRRSSMRKLLRQTSVVETQRDVDGNIKMTYWF